MADQQLDDELKTLQGKIALGVEALAFLQGPVGTFIVTRAEAEIADAVEALKVVDPEDAKAVRTLQNTIKVCEDIQYWLGEAIQDAYNAQQQTDN